MPSHHNQTHIPLNDNQYLSAIYTKSSAKYVEEFREFKEFKEFKEFREFREFREPRQESFSKAPRNIANLTALMKRNEFLQLAAPRLARAKRSIFLSVFYYRFNQEKLLSPM